MINLTTFLFRKVNWLVLNLDSTSRNSWLVFLGITSLLGDFKVKRTFLVLGPNIRMISDVFVDGLLLINFSLYRDVQRLIKIFLGRNSPPDRLFW